MESVEDIDEKSNNNNGKPWKIVEDFACEAKFIHFSLFIIFLHFFRFFLIFHFSFIFFHFLSFSFHFPSFSLSLLVPRNLIFLGLNFVTIFFFFKFSQEKKFFFSFFLYFFQLCVIAGSRIRV